MIVTRISHWKRRKTKQQPSRARSSNQLLLSFPPFPVRHPGADHGYIPCIPWLNILPYQKCCRIRNERSLRVLLLFWCSYQSSIALAKSRPSQYLRRAKGVRLRLMCHFFPHMTRLSQQIRNSHVTPQIQQQLRRARNEFRFMTSTKRNLL